MSSSHSWQLSASDLLISFTFPHLLEAHISFCKENPVYQCSCSPISLRGHNVKNIRNVEIFVDVLSRESMVGSSLFEHISNLFYKGLYLYLDPPIPSDHQSQHCCQSGSAHLNRIASTVQISSILPTTPQSQVFLLWAVIFTSSVISLVATIYLRSWSLRTIIDINAF